MKYFSPGLLDGSVTTAKLADNAVNSAKIGQGGVRSLDIATVDSSQSGTIAIQGKVAVVLNPYTLWADIEADMPASATLDVQMLANFKAVPAAAADSPIFDLRNEDTGFTRAYDVAWRHIAA